LGGAMLPSTGEGENNMKVFIQEHMTSILQPLAETVTEMQRAIRKIKDSTAQATGIAERSMEHISAHEQKLVMFGSGLSRVTEDILHQRNELSEVADRQVTIEGDLDLQKVGLNKLEGYIAATATADQDVRKMIDDVDARVRQVQLSVSETNVNHMAFADRLSEIRNLHDGLNDRHMQMMSALQNLRQSEENTRSVLKRHVSTCEKQKKDAQRSFALIDDRLKSAEAICLETTHKTQTNAKSLKSLSTDLKHVLGELGEVVGQQQGGKGDDAKQQQPTKAAQDQSPAERFGNRMGRIEESISALHRNQAFEKEGAGIKLRELEDLVKKTVADSRDNSLCIELHSKTQKSQEERILRNETRQGQCDSNIDKVQKMADKLDADTRELVLNGRELTAMVEHEKHEREKISTNLSNNGKDLEVTNTNVYVLNKDLLDIQSSMVKIGMRLELAHEYFQGMTKGFQDTHKRVNAGLDGMVAPKTVSHRKILPDLPGSKNYSGEGRDRLPSEGRSGAPSPELGFGANSRDEPF